MKHQGNYGRNLETGLVFAQAGCGDVYFILGDDIPEPRDGQFPTDNDTGDPGRHPSQGGEHDQRAGDQQLVRHRVHDLAQVGDQPVSARQVSVKIVGDGSGAENKAGQECREAVRHHQQHHDDRHRDDPEQRQGVGVGEK